MGLSQATGPNGDVTTVNYNSFGLPLQTVSAAGAVTTIAYTYSPPTQTVTTNGHYVKTYYDGPGRTIKVENGDGTGVKSVAETEYDSCAFTPMGKMKRVSQPYCSWWVGILDHAFLRWPRQAGDGDACRWSEPERLLLCGQCGDGDGSGGEVEDV